MKAKGTSMILSAVVALGLVGAPAGSTSAAQQLDGKTLYAQRCGMCHQTIGMAVNILARRTADESKGILEDRNDLTAAFVRTVVRSGIVSDPELAAVASYLSKGKP
jgi:mono/diheme cytochrome c family protein